MKKEGNKYILNTAELGALIGASIETATKVLHEPWYDPNDNGLPYFVNRGHNLLYGSDLYSQEELDGCLVTDENGTLIEDEGLYKAVKDVFWGCAVEVHAIYAPENNCRPDWLSAAVDLFRLGNTYRVWFTYNGANTGSYHIYIEHLEKWWMG